MEVLAMLCLHFRRQACTRTAFLALGLAFLTLSWGGGDSPFPNSDSTWDSIYPVSQTDDNVINGTGKSCQLCHADDTGNEPWNAYGWEIRGLMQSGSTLSQAINAIGGVDSDGSGFSSNAEIGSDTQPGWRPGPVNTLYFKNGSTTQNQSPPALILGALDPCAGSGSSYCTAKTNSQGCVPQISSVGTASLTNPGPFQIDAVQLLNGKNGLFFYGSMGRAALPFQGGTLCMFPPLRRTSVQFSGGNMGPPDCSGVLTFDFNAWFQGGNDTLLAVGQTIDGQFWTRDPQQADGTGVGLTDAIEFSLCP